MRLADAGTERTIERCSIPDCNRPLETRVERDPDGAIRTLKVCPVHGVRSVSVSPRPESTGEAFA
jgi:hypothetical protein